MSDTETCSNCACELPRSEQAYVFDGMVVCAKCNGDLRARKRLESYDLKQLRLLYARSREVSSAAIFFVIPTLICTIGPVGAVVEGAPLFPIVYFLVLGCFSVCALVGMFRRTSWGRILGIIACVLLLPLLIGLLWVFAFIRAPELFGPDKITRRQLIDELERRKPGRDRPKSRLGRIWRTLTKER